MEDGDGERGEVVGMEVMIDGKPMEEWVERVSSAFKNHLRRIEVLEKLHYKDHPYPEDHNYPEPVHSKPKPHTCGECRRPWRKESDGGMIFMLACRHNKKPDKEVSWRSEDDEACGKFKSREESCT